MAYRKKEYCSKHQRVIYDGYRTVECPQCEADPAPTEEEMTEREPNARFVIRNAITTGMEAIVSYECYLDPETGKAPDGRAAFMVLLAMAQFAWAEESVVYPGNKLLAKMTGYSRKYVEVVKRALVFAGAMKYVGENPTHHTDDYEMSLAQIEEYIERVSLPVPEELKTFMKKHYNPAADAAEEAAMYADDDMEARDQSTEDPDYKPEADDAVNEVKEKWCAPGHED